jgi:thiaminase (transcriptional activator TenA)
MSAGLTERLRAPCEATWDSLVSNAFVGEMADASLPLDNFRFYVEQNLFYLPQYARALGLGLARSITPAELVRFARSIHQIIDIEIEKNRHLLDRVIELGAKDRQGAREPSPVCLAYTNHLLAVAATGSTAEVMATILPCAWSYGDIAARYPNAKAHPVYGEWLSFFGNNAYAEYVTTLRSEFDDIVGEITEAELELLQGRFLAGARYERAFWGMAHELEQWPTR